MIRINSGLEVSQNVITYCHKDHIYFEDNSFVPVCGCLTTDGGIIQSAYDHSSCPIYDYIGRKYREIKPRDSYFGSAHIKDHKYCCINFDRFIDFGILTNQTLRGKHVNFNKHLIPNSY